MRHGAPPISSVIVFFSLAPSVTRVARAQLGQIIGVGPARFVNILNRDCEVRAGHEVVRQELAVLDSAAPSAQASGRAEASSSAGKIRTEKSRIGALAASVTAPFSVDSRLVRTTCTLVTSSPPFNSIGESRRLRPSNRIAFTNQPGGANRCAAVVCRPGRSSRRYRRRSRGRSGHPEVGAAPNAE